MSGCSFPDKCSCPHSEDKIAKRVAEIEAETENAVELYPCDEGELCDCPKGTCAHECSHSLGSDSE